jgi:hypothetical protein
MNSIHSTQSAPCAPMSNLNLNVIREN